MEICHVIDAVKPSFGTLIIVYCYMHCLPHGYKKKINILAAYKQPRKKDQGKRKKERKR